jgi:hypothetical protein
MTIVRDLSGSWCDPKSIANILSLKHVTKKYHVAFDSKNGVLLVVTKPDGTMFKFKQSPGGLYFLDTDRKSTVMVNTIAKNTGRYTNDDYLKAVCARELQIMIGQPPNTKHFIQIVTSNHLPNCPVTRADIVAAEHIFRPDVGSLKGKTVRRQPHLAKPIIEPLRPKIMSGYHNVTLAADVMYVNGIPMLVTISQNIHFATIEALPNCNISMLVNGIKAVAMIYKQASFRITTTLMDGEFKPMQGELADLGVGKVSPAHQKREAVAYIKGRRCTDGQKQRAYTAAEGAALLTVATKSVFVTAVIDALEEHDVAALNVPGPFMQADMDFTGKMVDLLLEIDRDMYGPCVMKEGKETVMYVELL